MEKVWLITGCSTGFGRELAKQVLEKGDKVLVTARNIADVNDIVNAYPELAVSGQLDVTRAVDVDACVALAMEKFGRIDILVNNAGIGIMGAIEESDEYDVRRMFEINFFGLDRVTRKVLPIMRKQQSGYIVNISSGGGIMSHQGVGFYCASKFAVEGYSESLAKEIAPLGIKTLIVEPGPFRTDWAGRSATYSRVEIPDYRDTVGKMKSIMRDGSGKQPGDPIKAVKAILKVMDAENPPLRLVLGADAFSNVQEKLQQLHHDFDTWQELSLSADYTIEQ